jgi:hypothetical protein
MRSPAPERAAAWYRIAVFNLRLHQIDDAVAADHFCQKIQASARIPVKTKRAVST